jgi:replicative superfamily II helicase
MAIVITFSPYMDKGHHLKNCVRFSGSFEQFAFDGKKSILIFVSKASLYDGRFKTDFEKYINKFNEINDRRALEIIERVEELLGANSKDHQSTLVNLLKIGIVIHHGSVPLDVRFLIEDFIREGFAKICFATSTLAQGINMPFDIVWLENMKMQAENDEARALAFKNLIGRSGRLTNQNIFDFGYVYTKSASLLSERVRLPYEMSELSILEEVANDTENDMHEFVTSILGGSFDEKYNMPQSRIERFSSEDITYCIRVALKIIFESDGGKSLGGAENQENRLLVRQSLKKILRPQ